MFQLIFHIAILCVCNMCLGVYVIYGSSTWQTVLNIHIHIILATFELYSQFLKHIHIILHSHPKQYNLHFLCKIKGPYLCFSLIIIST